MNVLSMTDRRGQDWAKAATHCIYGHELAGSNVSVNEKGWRKCRACHRRNQAEYLASIREARA